MSVAINTRQEFHRLAELVQQIQTGQETGRLVCQKENEQAYIYFEDGQIVHALYDTLSGQEVLYALLNWFDGYLYFEEKSQASHYETRRTVGPQQSQLFKQTLGLFQPAEALPPPTHTSPPPAIAPVRLPPVAAPGLVLPPGRRSKPPLKLNRTDPARLLALAVSEKLTGYLIFYFESTAQPETALLLLEQGQLVAARYALPERIVAGQTAYDILAETARRGEMTVGCYQCEPNMVAAYRAVLGEPLGQPGLPATTDWLIEQVQQLVQSHTAAALRLTGPTACYYYLLSEGEALGGYVVKHSQLEAVEMPFARLVEAGQTFLTVLVASKAEIITYQAGVARPKVAVNPGSNVKQSIAGLLLRGRRPQAAVPVSLTNFNGLRRAFEQKAYSGLIEIVLPDEAKLYYVIEQGLPLGLYQFDAATDQSSPSRYSLSETLKMDGAALNVYIEEPA